MKFRIKVPDSLNEKAHEGYWDEGIYYNKDFWKKDAFIDANEDVLKQLALCWSIPAEFILASETDLSAPGLRYLLPIAPHDMFQPAIEYSILHGDKGTQLLTITKAHGFLSHANFKKMKFRAKITHTWPSDVWRRNFSFIAGNDGWHSLGGFIAISLDRNTGFLHLQSGRKIVDSENPMRNPGRGKSKPPELYDALYPLLEMKWSQWEKDRTKQFTRAQEIADSGTYPEMKEDNFVNICKRAGFLR